MPRGKRNERVYTGKAAKKKKKVKALEETLKTVKAERKAAYKEQLKEKSSGPKTKGSSKSSREFRKIDRRTY